MHFNSPTSSPRHSPSLTFKYMCCTFQKFLKNKYDWLVAPGQVDLKSLFGAQPRWPQSFDGNMICSKPNSNSNSNSNFKPELKLKFKSITLLQRRVLASYTNDTLQLTSPFRTGPTLGCNLNLHLHLNEQNSTFALGYTWLYPLFFTIFEACWLRFINANGKRRDRYSR